jgi:hypothetical protein
LLSFLDLSCTCSGQPDLFVSFFPCHIVVLFVWWRLSMSTIVEWRKKWRPKTSRGSMWL